MALPDEVAAGLYLNGLPAAKQTRQPGGADHPRITGDNVTRLRARYNLQYQAGPGDRRPGYRITDSSPRNILFVGNIENGIAIGRMSMPPAQDTHVYSDNYGGCEWHILSRPGKSAAFLHVYRGGGATVAYAMAGGWNHRGTIESGPIAQRIGMNGGSIVSYAFVAAGSTRAQCCMLVLDNQGCVSSVEEEQEILLS